MKRTLLRKFIICALAINILMVGQSFAQTSPNPPVARRNSPYAPNPKKKVEPTPLPQVTENNTAVLNEGKIVKIKDDKTVNLTASDRVELNELKTADSQKRNEEFTSRSVAAKTLEIPKQANPASVFPTEIYKVGVSDILFISLQNSPAKDSTYYTVLADGTIDYPLAGEMVNVVGRTTEQIEEILKEKIKLYKNPQVSVKVREHGSHIFTVLGLVEKTGEMQMQRDAIPLYVVRTEAIVNSAANQVSIKRTGTEPQTLDLTDLKTGEVLIFPGDIVEFISDETLKNSTSDFYFIGGEINSGGRRDYVPGLTLTQAIIESGGLRKSNARKVIIRRKNDAGLLVPAHFDLKAIKNGKMADPVLEAGDTIEIEN